MLQKQLRYPEPRDFPAPPAPQDVIQGLTARAIPSSQPEEEKAARGPSIYLQIPEGWVSGGRGQALFSGAQ